MDVTFTRTGHRRYAVQIGRPGFPPVEMNPAPGFDPALPHDLVHFVVEDELRLPLGVFGQLAAGGDAGSFYLPPAERATRERTRAQRRTRRRGSALGREGRHDADLSERLASVFHHDWLRHSRGGLAEARDMEAYAAKVRASLSDAERALLSDAAISRIRERLDRLSQTWSRLGIGESMTLTWRGRP